MRRRELWVAVVLAVVAAALLAGGAPAKKGDTKLIRPNGRAVARGPNTPGPASCIAPKPMRPTGRSPSWEVLFAVMPCL